MREFPWHLTLKEGLPDVSAPYPLDKLTEAEALALERTLRDGFGEVEAEDAWSGPLPDEVDPGILDHRFYMDGRHREDLEEDEEYRDDTFWRESDGDTPPGPFEGFPLRFDLTSIKIYFGNQRLRFIEVERRRMMSGPDWLNDCDQQGLAPVVQSDEDETWSEAASESTWEMAKFYLYQKPWYEYHALHLVALVALCDETVVIKGRDGVEYRRREVAGHLAMNWMGQLGRLVEQYYWRFKFERAAKTGIATSEAARAGGLARSARLRHQHSTWNEVANDIWSRRADLSKVAIAELVRRQLGLPQTAKHIARFIERAEFRNTGAGAGHMRVMSE